MNATPSSADKPKSPVRPRVTPVRLVTAAIVIAVYWWSVEGTGLNIVTLIEGLPNFGEMLRQMFPPDVGYAARLWEPLVETLAIGILATLIGSVLAIPMGFLAAENISHAAIYYPARMVLNVLRGISELIWALLFVVAVGLGPFAGVLALVIFSVGVLGKLIAEALEAVEPGPLDAMRATGASRWKVFLYGAWPQILPLYLSYCLYWWDHNTRQATILGFVGAGGLGYSLFFSITTFEFEKATTAILSMILVITVIDRFCLYLRKKII